MGFTPPKINQFSQQLLQLAHGVYVFFVSPQNVEKVLEVLEAFNQEKKEKIEVFLAKEMTKIFEERFWGSPETVKEKVKNVKGEFTLVIKIPKPTRVKVNKYPKIN